MEGCRRSLPMCPSPGPCEVSQSHTDKHGMWHSAPRSCQEQTVTSQSPLLGEEPWVSRSLWEQLQGRSGGCWWNHFLRETELFTGRPQGM